MLKLVKSRCSALVKFSYTINPAQSIATNGGQLRYQVVIVKDDGTTLTIGNTIGDVEDTNTIEIQANGPIKIAKVNIDNLNGQYDDEFSSENVIDIYIRDEDNTLPLYHRFTGEVLEAVPNRDNTRITLICKDVNNLLAERLITGVWTNIDLGEFIYQVMAEKAPEIDNSTINQTTGIVIDEIRSEARKILDLFNDVFRENTYQFYIDNDKISQLFDDNRGNSTVVLADGSGGNVIDGTQNLKRSSISKKNSVTVIGGTEADNQTDNFVYTGTAQFTLREQIKPNTTPVVEVNGSPSGVTFTQSSDGRVVEVTSSLSTNDTVDVTYDFEKQVWWQETLLGATNLKEVAIKDETIITINRARDVAVRTIDKLGVTVIKGTVGATDMSTDFQLFETLELNTVSGFAGTQTIKGYTENLAKDYRVTFQLTELLDIETRKLVQTIQELEKVKGTGKTAIVRDGISVFDVPDDEEDLVGEEQGIGTRWIFDHPTNSAMDDSKTMDDYGTSLTQFLPPP